jgi:hypothetical protein
MGWDGMGWDGMVAFAYVPPPSAGRRTLDAFYRAEFSHQSLP